MRTMRRSALATSLLCGGLFVACTDSTSVPDLNNVTTEALNNGLSPALVSSLVNGLLDADRGNNGGGAGNAGAANIVFAETMARDVYNITSSEPRWITELIEGTPTDAGGFIATNGFGGWFYEIRTGNLILNGLNSVVGYSDKQKASTRGLVQTIEAVALYHALEQRDTVGLPIDLNRPASAPLADIRCKTNVLAYLSALLDSGYTNLQAGGASFPFSLPPGFSLRGDFTTPATFAKFNRGLKGRVELYRALDHFRPDPTAYARALTALNQSFISIAPADTGLGPYFVFSTSVGESVNPVGSTSTLHLNPSVGDSILAGDARSYKIIANRGPYSGSGVKTTYDPYVALSNATNLVRPLAQLKNEELILLRAQAEIGTGDLAAATADINYVRVNGGGLPAYPVFTTAAAAINAVLYEKRYSLLLEGAQRLVDLRAYNRMNANFLKKEVANDLFISALPLPKTETDARNGNVTPVCQ